MQSILGKINFVCRFIFDFVDIVKPLKQMINKDSNYRWMKERKEEFAKIKEAIVKDPTLRSPDIDKEFILYTFVSNYSIVLMVTQKDEVKEYFLISFMSTGLQGA